MRGNCKNINWDPEMSLPIIGGDLIGRGDISFSPRDDEFYVGGSLTEFDSVTVHNIRSGNSVTFYRVPGTIMFSACIDGIEYKLF